MEKCCGNCYFFKDETVDGFGKCDVTVGFQSCEHCCDKWNAKEDEKIYECNYCGEHIAGNYYLIKNAASCRECYDKWQAKEDKVDDDINNPKHYTQGKIEVIDFIEDMPCCEANIIKYVARYKYKGKPLQDLKKARWYLDRLIKKEE